MKVFIDFMSVCSRENKEMPFGQNVQIMSQRSVCVYVCVCVCVCPITNSHKQKHESRKQQRSVCVSCDSLLKLMRLN